MSETIRPTLFDSLSSSGTKNIYCELKNLTNEASVETFFVNRMLADMGFKDNHIKTKESIEKLKISKGSKSFYYKPDYCIVFNRKPKLVIDAKSPHETIEKYIEQCAHYCLILNRRGEKKTLEYFILSNGIKTVLFKWDSDLPILELKFSDFNYGNKNYEKLRSIVAYPNLSKGGEDKAPE